MEVVASAKRAARSAGLRRSDLAFARMRAERAFGAAKPNQDNRRPRILAYHAVGTPAWGVNDCSLTQFEEQLALARRMGRRFVDASSIAAGNGKPGDLAVTFDDGVASVITNAAPLLSRLGIPWTVFVTVDYAGGQSAWPAGTFATWDELRRVAEFGGRIGSHALSHQNFSRLSAEEARTELTESRRKLEEHLGVEVNEFAIPFGRARDWTSDAHAVAMAEYRTVYSYTEDRRFPGTVGRSPVTRFDGSRTFAALLNGAFDSWQEWF